MIDAFAGSTHHIVHVRPVFDALDDDIRGVFWERPKLFQAESERGTLTLVSSYLTLKLARARTHQVAYMEHGAGFSYGDPYNAYAGAADRDRVVFFLEVNNYTARRNHAAHPDIPQALVGCPKLDPMWAWPRKQPSTPPVVCISTHWDIQRVPETRSAFRFYEPGIAALARLSRKGEIELIGHGHPRHIHRLLPFYRQNGVEVVPDFADVMRRADLYMSDTTSTLYEFAALDRPVLTLNAPFYRRDVDFGIRFWDHIPGLQVDEPGRLVPAVLQALADPAEAQERRRAAVEAVYPVGRDGTAARMAAAALGEFHRR